MQGGHGVDRGIERLVALALAARLPEPDRTAALEAGYHALGGELAEEFGITLHREVQHAGSGLAEAKPREQRVLGGIDADDEERRLAFGARRPPRPERHAGAAAALDRPDAAVQPRAAVFVGRLGVLTTRIDRHRADGHVGNRARMRISRL